MSKDFDATLSEALHLAANAAQTPGPAAARIRGRKRTVHQRIAVSTASLALVAVATTVAFKASPSHSDSAPVAGTSTNLTVNASKSAGTAGHSTSADPRKVVPGAWLAANQLPFADTFQWKVQQATSQGSPIGRPLTPTVFYVANDTSLQTLTTCSDPSWLLPRTTGAQHSEYLGTTGTGNNQASQYLFFFADRDSAQLTFNTLVKQYGPACAKYDGGAQPTLTAGDLNQAGGLSEMVWLTVKGKSTAPDLPAYTREYFVLRGNVIAYVAATSYTDTGLPTAYNDAAQLSTIASHVCVYGGACK